MNNVRKKERTRKQRDKIREIKSKVRKKCKKGKGGAQNQETKRSGKL